MKKEECVLLEALKCSLYDLSFDINMNDFSIQQWQQLKHLADIHQIQPMIYNVLYPFIPQNFKGQWKKQAFYLSTIQIQRTNEFLSLYQELCNYNIIPLVIKGLICRNIYPQPDLRISGDEDLLVKKEDFQKVDAFLIQKGFQREQEFDKNSEEIGYRHLENGLYLEIHTQLFSYDSVYSFLNQEFQDVFDRAVSIDIQNHRVYTFDYTDHLFYLFCHAYKHFVHGGFGFRQLCDMMMFMNAYHGYIDYDVFDEKMKKYCFQVFWNNLLDIGEQYLGFSYTKAHYHQSGIITDSRDLLDDIFDSGIYGRSSAERTHSAQITLTALKPQDSSFINSIFDSLFPRLSYMKKQYTYLNKYPFLLFVAYIQRIYAYIKERKLSKEKKTSLSMGKKRIELLKKYQLIRTK